MKNQNKCTKILFRASENMFCSIQYFLLDNQETNNQKQFSLRIYFFVLFFFSKFATMQALFNLNCITFYKYFFENWHVCTNLAIIFFLVENMPCSNQTICFYYVVLNFMLHFYYKRRLLPHCCKNPPVKSKCFFVSFLYLFLMLREIILQV